MKQIHYLIKKAFIEQQQQKSQTGVTIVDKNHAVVILSLAIERTTKFIYKKLEANLQIDHLIICSFSSASPIKK